MMNLTNLLQDSMESVSELQVSSPLEYLTVSAAGQLELRRPDGELAWNSSNVKPADKMKVSTYGLLKLQSSDGEIVWRSTD